MFSGLYCSKTDRDSFKKGKISIGPQELIDILKEAEGFIIKDKVKDASLSYCIPRALPEITQKIYALFGKDYPKRPYKWEEDS